MTVFRIPPDALTSAGGTYFGQCADVMENLAVLSPELVIEPVYIQSRRHVHEIICKPAPFDTGHDIRCLVNIFFRNAASTWDPGAVEYIFPRGEYEQAVKRLILNIVNSQYCLSFKVAI